MKELFCTGLETKHEAFVASHSCTTEFLSIVDSRLSTAFLNAQVSDTTGDDKRTKAGYIKTIPLIATMLPFKKNNNVCVIML